MCGLTATLTMKKDYPSIMKVLKLYKAEREILQWELINLTVLTADYGGFFGKTDFKYFN